MTNHQLDQGNNETLTRGLFIEADGTFTALTYTQSKNFKTERGAVKWLAVRGLDKFGEVL